MEEIQGHQEVRIRRVPAKRRTRNKVHSARWYPRAGWWVTDCGVVYYSEDGGVEVTERDETCGLCELRRNYSSTYRQHETAPCGAPRRKEDHEGVPCRRPVAGGGRCPYHQETA